MWQEEAGIELTTFQSQDDYSTHRATVAVLWVFLIARSNSLHHNPVTMLP